LLGGSSLGQLTLSRFFFLHIAILPGISVACIGLHLVAFRKSGISGPWDEVKRKRTGPFWPDQVFKDGVIVTAIFVILVGLVAFFRAPFSGPLDIMETFYVPKPEWYFLFFYQTLKAFHGWLEPVGTIGVPLLLTLLFLFLPFIDRSPERNPARRPTAMIVFCIFVAWVITMAIIGHYSKPEAAAKGTAGEKTAGAQTAPSILSNPPVQISAGVSRGAQLFNSLGCIACHMIQGRGGVVGPELNAKLLQGKSSQWLITQVRDPKAHNPQTIMPAFSSATDQQVNDVVAFLLNVAQAKIVSPARAGKPSTASRVTKAPPPPAAVTGPHGPPEAASFVIGNVDLGATIFSQSCAPCHGPQGTDKVPNPGSTDGTVPSLNPIDPELFNKNAQIFTNNIDRFIQHGSRPEGQNPALTMLPFGDGESLTQQMIANVEAYLLHLNGVDRAQPVHPGIQPRLFFWLVVIAFGLFGLGLGGLWIQMHTRLGKRT
jgi:sulfur oxidation c-type cytochrome SoxX